MGGEWVARGFTLGSSSDKNRLRKINAKTIPPPSIKIRGQKAGGADGGGGGRVVGVGVGLDPSGVVCAGVWTGR